MAPINMQEIYGSDAYSPNEIAERIEADAAPDLTAPQRRGIAAYRRAVEATPYQWSAACGERWSIGDRVQIGDPADPYYHGIMVALGLSHTVHGKPATAGIHLDFDPKTHLLRWR